MVGMSMYLTSLKCLLYLGCMYNFDIDTKIDQTIAQNPTRDEKRSLNSKRLPRWYHYDIFGLKSSNNYFPKI